MIYSGSRHCFMRFEHVYISSLKYKEAGGMKKEEGAAKRQWKKQKPSAADELVNSE